MRQRLNLKNHCIKTEIKRIYNSKLSFCLRKRAMADADEDEIKALKYALEFFDFPWLRSSFPELMGGNNADVFLVRVKERGLMIEINNELVQVLLTKKVKG